MNPEFFDIEEKKTFGLWPHDQLISVGINPYVKRIREDKIAMAIIGDLRGESTVHFLENSSKIVKINVVNNYAEEHLKELFNKNTEGYKSKIDFGLSKDKKRDIVCIDKDACNPENLELYYQNVKQGGIFCGNGHDSIEVKQALNDFRRKVKIGTPIQVCHRTIWFWYVR
jgi:ribosomal protein L7Ae-like RNA K-turn-binding protein